FSVGTVNFMSRTPEYDYSDIDLQDPLWTRRHIAKFISKGDTATRLVLRTAGCPSPVGLFADTWVPAEFQAFWLSQRAPAPAQPARVPAPARRGAADPLL